MQLFRLCILSHITLLLFFCLEGRISNKRVPRLTVIVIVDQCAARFLYSQDLASHYSHGLARLLKQGIVYHNAFFPHGKPETAVGHAALNTGTYAEYHGFISNDWYENDVHRACDDDPSDHGKLLTTESSKTGKSARNLMVDGISDQFVLANPAHNHAVSISTKSRSAIAISGHLGKPIWFDIESASFTSSRAFFDSIPAFVEKFNKKKNLKARQSIVWNPCDQANTDRFSTVVKEGYTFSQHLSGFFKNSKPLFGEKGKTGLFWYLCSPESMYDLFELGKETINTYLAKNEDSLLLWISIGAFDKLGHAFGPNSFEVRDFLCHLDSELDKFIRFSQKAVGKGNFVCFFTADHGVSAMPEVLDHAGLPAKRILITPILHNLNEQIKSEFGIQEVIIDFDCPHVYLNHEKMKMLSPEKQKNLLDYLKNLIFELEGVKQVWISAELAVKPVTPCSIESDFKRQLFKGRSGDLIVQTQPLYLFTSHKKGASHATPYAHDTHVPLICYAPRRSLPQKIYQPVSPLQLPSTLSALLRVPLPSAAEKEVLPGIFTTDSFLEAL